jgi:hypothetical protein
VKLLFVRAAYAKDGVSPHLLAVAVVHTIFYGLLQTSRLPFVVFGGWPSVDGPNWHLSYSAPIVLVSLGLLMWSILVPMERHNGKITVINRWIHSLSVVTAALNCVLAMATFGASVALNKEVYPTDQPIKPRFEKR